MVTRHQSSRALLTRQRGHSSSTPTSYTHLSVEGGGEDRWVSPDVAEHVRLMHEITWGPLVSVFSEVRVALVWRALARSIPCGGGSFRWCDDGATGVRRRCPSVPTIQGRAFLCAVVVLALPSVVLVVCHCTPCLLGLVKACV